MSEYEVATPKTRPRFRKRYLLLAAALITGVVLGLLLLSVFAHVAHAGQWDQLAAVLTGRRTRINADSPSVVDKIRQLSRLETVDYSIDKIVEGDKENPYLPNFLVGDKLMLVAHGEVIAGVDLSQFEANNIHVNGDAINVKLPDPQVLVTRIDDGGTRVYSRTTGLLVPADPNLESQVRVTAEQEITKAALADGILDKANQNARISIKALLSGLGFHSVDVH